MIRWAANLTVLFADVPVLQRFERARAAGFRYVELLLPYGHDVGAIAAELRRLDLEMVLFNLPAGDWEAGERGIAADPGRREEFRQGVAQAMELARRLGVNRLNCLAGRRLQALPAEEQWACLVDNLRYAADRLASQGITLLVEAVNDRDVPGFLVTRTRQALELLEEVGRPNVRLQCDVYHMQIMEGNLTRTLCDHVQRIGHVQIADVPGRHQPGTGEIRYPFVLRALDEAGYDGFVSLEYVPRGSTETSLQEAAASGLAELGLPHPG